MITNKQCKLINKLKLKKNRHKEGLFIVEGEKNVLELINSTMKIHSLYCLPSFLSKINLDFNCVFEINELELTKISSLKTPNKVLAVFYIQKTDTLYKKNELILALDQIKDPGNLGTIIRLADWYGINTILCSSNTVDAFNPKVIMATMGSISRVNIKYCNLEVELPKIKKNIYGAFLDGENIYTNKKINENAILVIGNESNGISSEIEAIITKRISIPKFGTLKETESLNAAIATGIIVSEIVSKKIR